MTIGDSIRYHRKRLGLTQLALAERVGVSVQAISKWETNTGLPDITMAVPLARALGTTTDELLQFGQRRRELEQLWSDTLDASRCDSAAMFEAAREALKEFPWDPVFLYRAAYARMEWAEEQQDPQIRQNALSNAAAYAQSAVEAAPNDESCKWIWRESRKRLTAFPQP